MPPLAILIPTQGRATLERTLDSLVCQLMEHDCIIIALDTHQMTATQHANIEKRVIRAAQSFASQLHIVEYNAGHSCWGHCQLNAAMLMVASHYWLVFNDDDDIFTPNAFDTIRSAINAQTTPRPLLFQFITPWRQVLWSRAGQVTITQVGGHCLVLRQDMVGDARWTERYEGDFDMINAVVEAHGGPQGVDWVPEVIAYTRPVMAVIQ